MKTKLQKLFLTLLTLAASSQKLGVNLIRVAILVIFVWIGGLKFWNYEAEGINFGVALLDILTIFVGFNIVKRIPRLTYYYNIYLIGVVLSPAFFQIEILQRVCLLFKLFQFIILGYAFYIFLWRKKRVDNYSHILIWIIFFNIIRVYIINVFLITDTDTILYIWDSKGRDFLLN